MKLNKIAKNVRQTKLVTLFSALFLVACASQHKIIYVPTPIKCPQPIIKPEPDYSVKHLTQADKANPGAVVKSYVVSLKQCMVQNKALRTQLEGYRHD